MEIIRFPNKLNHEGVISELMSGTQVFGTIALCLLCYVIGFIVCTSTFVDLLRASLCLQFHCVPFLSGKFHVFSVTSSVSIFAAKLKLANISLHQL